MIEKHITCQTHQIKQMKLLTEWQAHLRKTWPHAVHVSSSSDFTLMVSWLTTHVGTPFDAWVNADLQYLFKHEHDAHVFSLTWT